ncbi:MAG: hypothetical protein KDA21_01390 [Phycisphaerales bacterium]|nr:hypothetical protein [Phycisphaerales bacterium]
MIRRAISVAALSLLGLAGCAGSRPAAQMLDHRPVARAEAVPSEAWNNLYHDGPIWFGGQPQLSGLQALPDEGIRTVINVRTEPEMSEEQIGFDEMSTVMQGGMEYIRIPVSPDTLSNNDADRLAAVLSRRSEPVVIHCGSANRAGGLWALYLYRHRGVPVDEAIEIGRSAGLRSDAMEQAVRRVIAESP